MSTVVIIGAGLAGLTTAHALQKRGCQVTVVDTNPAPAMGTSFANAGMLTPSMADPWNTPGLLPYLIKSIGRENSSFLLRLGALPQFASWALRFIAYSGQGSYQQSCEANFKLAQFSLNQLRLWTDELELEFEQRQKGTLKIFRQAEASKTANRVAEQLEPLGLTVKQLSPQQVSEQEPSLGPIEAQLVSGLWYPNDDSGNAFQFCQQLASKIEAQGGQLRYGESFKRWRWQRGQVSGFSSAAADYDADAVVLAAGVHSPALLASLELDLMVRPVKGYSLSINAQGVDGLPNLPVIDEALHCAITPLGDTLRVAGTAELAGFDTRKRAARMNNLRTMLQEVLPEAAPNLRSRPQREWAGLRPMSADGKPYVGRVKQSGKHHRASDKLWLNTGHGHLGWTHCVGSAELLAAELLGEPLPLDNAPFSAERVLRRA